MKARKKENKKKITDTREKLSRGEKKISLPKQWGQLGQSSN